MERGYLSEGEYVEYSPVKQGDFTFQHSQHTRSQSTQPSLTLHEPCSAAQLTNHPKFNRH
jgi:hypothetical protein